MKKTFRLLTLTALALTMAACSNEDDFADIPARGNGIPFSATISIGNGTTTRTVLTEGTDDVTGKGILNVAWKGDGSEQVALIHNGVSDVMTISGVSGGKATINGELTGEFNTGDAVRIVYPASYVQVATGGTDYTADASAFTAQDGTLTTIGTILDVREGMGTLTKNTTPASLSSNVTMASQIAIWKLTLNNYESAPTTTLNAKKLTIKDGSDNTLAATTTLSTGKSEFYMAVPVSGTGIKIEAVKGTDTYVLSKSGVTLTAGTYYQSTAKLARPLSSAKVPSGNDKMYASPGDVGKVVSADGRLFTTAAAATAAGTSGVAMICYVSGVGHGLAIELNSNPGSSNWYDAPATATTGKTAILGATEWRLPSNEDWSLMFDGCNIAASDSPGSSAVTPYYTSQRAITNLRTMYNAAAGYDLPAAYYWSSTELDGEDAWDVNLGSSMADFRNFYKYQGLRVLACLAF